MCSFIFYEEIQPFYSALCSMCLQCMKIWPAAKVLTFSTVFTFSPPVPPSVCCVNMWRHQPTGVKRVLIGCDIKWGEMIHDGGGYVWKRSCVCRRHFFICFYRYFPAEKERGRGWQDVAKQQLKLNQDCCSKDTALIEVSYLHAREETLF